MSLLVFIFLLALIFKNFRLDNLFSMAFKGIGALIALSIITVVLTDIMFSPVGILGAIGLGIFFHNQKKKKREEKRKQEKYGWNAEGWDKSKNNKTTYDNVSIPIAKNPKFPRSTSGRKKICEKFNEKYSLDLSDYQIMSIVNASYMSEIWLAELEAMNQKYENVYEWFNGPTSWLRVYMHVFHIQEITSDIRAQESIVMYAFQSVLSYADTLEGYSLSEKIEKINSKFLTSFDDVSFMIAYRFIEAKGLKHQLSGQDLVKNESEIDRLLEKYQDESGNNKPKPKAK